MAPQTLTEQQRIDWLRLARTPRIGPVTFAQLIAKYKTASAALAALPTIPATRNRLTIPDADHITSEIEQTVALGGQIICACEPHYPVRLRWLDPPPPIITALGDLELTTRPCIAIVGARNASAAGLKMAFDMAADLSNAGYTTISGMARGIDGSVHTASLHKGTIAVLAGGVDHIYPKSHHELYDKIREKGLLISERPLGYYAIARDFPRRNRLVTGLSDGVILIEAAARSGSGISARTAGEQGREVMVVPGSPLDPRFDGSNHLIREGATLVRNADDVIEAVSRISGPVLRAPAPISVSFNYPAPDGLSIPPEQYSAVRQALSFTPTGIEDIARAAAIGADRCAIILLELELSGYAETFAGGLASRAPEP